MAKSRLDPAAYKAAVALAQEIEATVAFAATPRFDPARRPQLTFQQFPVPGATCAVGPDSAYRLLKAAVDAAQTSLDLYIYDISAPYLVDLLRRAKARGVRIRSMYDANSQGDAELALLKEVGKTKAAPSSGDRQVFTVCHQKFLVIDGKTVVVESANWARTSAPEITQFGTYKKGNREWFVRVDDTATAAWFTKLFEADWNIPAAPVAAALGDEVVAGQLDVAVAAAAEPPSHLFDVTPVEDAAATVLPLVSPDNYLPEVKKLLKGAQSSIYLQQQYVLAGRGVKDLLEVLADKQAAGVDVRVVSSAAFPQNWQATQRSLEAAGLLGRLKAVRPASFTHCHNKGVIVDGRAVVVSSTNWSENSITRAREGGLLIRSAKIAKYYQDVFLTDWQDGIDPTAVESAMTVLEGADAV